MELYTFDKVGTVPQTHDQSLRRLGGDLQFIRESGTPNDEAMITIGRKWHGKGLEYSLSPGKYYGRFTIHWFSRSYNLSPLDFANGLVAQAHPQKWHVRPQRIDEL